MNSLPALEIGGSHVTAALVDPATGGINRRARRPLIADATARELLATIAEAASEIATAGAVWGAAVPGPFDYDTGIGRFHGVGKFTALNGVDVGAELLARITPAPNAIRFLNDAAAFGLGEWKWGAAAGHTRAVGITLGTGIGSSFLDAGHPVTTAGKVPPEGRVDLLSINGVPLEDVVSARALVAAYRTAGGKATNAADVMARADAGDHRAKSVVERSYHLLGTTLGPWLQLFEATIVVLGGGISTAWDQVSTPLQHGIAATSTAKLALIRTQDTEGAALRGAASWIISSQAAQVEAEEAVSAATWGQRRSLYR
ncbi:ROK family protein [Fodinicola feengrottensis]|uniref:ROK family protein n=1 Tax=Fodinicola feengrottensis TaxID=435914 RepID=A0ABN2GKG1_9ACTN